MKASFLFALFLFVAAAANGCQDNEMAAPGGAKEPVLRPEPGTPPAEVATTQPTVTEAPRRVLWWGDPKGAQGAGSPASPEATPSSRPSATVAAPTDGQ